MDRFIIGVDIGTTSTRAILFDGQGTAVASSATDYPTLYPAHGWAEQNPEVLFNAFLKTVKELIHNSPKPVTDISGISLSSAMYSLIAVDANGEALTNSIIWSDVRSDEIIENLKLIAPDDLYESTGCRLHATYPLAKIQWLKVNRPQIFNKSAKFISIKEYILHKLFRRYVVDWSIASATGMFNISLKNWEPKALDLLGISHEQLSVPVDTEEILRGLDQTFAREMGIPADIPVVIGAGDGPLANLGSGVIRGNHANIDVGTSGAIRVMTRSPIADPKQRIWCYNLADQYWVCGGLLSNVGNVLSWLAEQFFAKDYATNDIYRLLDEYASTVSAGSDGLIFLPHLSGERSPNWNALARGTMFGLSFHHKKEHMVRAVMEGIAYSVNEVYLALQEAAGEIEEIRVTGGVTKLPVWRQILADVLGKEIIIPEVNEASSLGAGILGFKALGFIDDFSQSSQMVKTKAVVVPNHKNHRIYSEYSALYNELYRNLIQQFHSLHVLSKAH